MRVILVLILILAGISACGIIPKKITPKEREMFRDVKVIRVVVEQSYGEANKVILPFLRKLTEGLV